MKLNICFIRTALTCPSLLATLSESIVNGQNLFMSFTNSDRQNCFYKKLEKDSFIREFGVRTYVWI